MNLQTGSKNPPSKFSSVNFESKRCARMHPALMRYECANHVTLDEKLQMMGFGEYVG